uniref:Meis_PKNOX_N domain-containing protein n=1 Tax=Ascaris lumbricoides TaxID=6252 RepID=A0A0M3HVS7_ASCLU
MSLSCRRGVDVRRCLTINIFLFQRAVLYWMCTWAECCPCKCSLPSAGPTEFCALKLFHTRILKCCNAVKFRSKNYFAHTFNPRITLFATSHVFSGLNAMLNHPSATAFAVTTSGGDPCGAMAPPPPAHQHRPHMGTLLNGSGAPLDANTSSTESVSMSSQQAQAAPWTLMGLMPQQSSAMHQQSATLPPRGGFFGDPSTTVPMRYPGVEENNGKEHLNSTFYQVGQL